MKIDPYRGSWGLRFLELELSNPTDVVFETSVSVEMENPINKESLSDRTCAEFGDPKTRIDRDYTARVLIPLEHFKLPVLDGSFLTKGSQMDGTTGGRSSSFSEKNIKAELNASIKNLISRIKVRWQSGRNSSGELDIKDAIQAALQASVMDVLLPDPLTFGFRLAKSSSNNSANLNPPKQADMQVYCVSGGSIIAHDMTPMEVLVRNNTRETIKINLSVTCKDVAGENCTEGEKATVLWEGAIFILDSVSLIYACVLTGIIMEIPPLQEIRHIFSLYFLIPGEYTMSAASVIDDANEVLRARARTNSSDEPIFCRGPPFHVRVNGTA
ncbi:UNVERIFIED_CONTAM: Trafficking protein particle complex II-specific subunit [Sesamum radiatum]|uniref:Trafficking protein particle complex II-specific subunit n=1 Tax=Sesamum radiatum TaxID=300843 RepID=A0AAW2TSX4_SESRA